MGQPDGQAAKNNVCYTQEGVIISTKSPCMVQPTASKLMCTYTVSQKNDTDVAGYIFNAHQPILIFFGR